MWADSGVARLGFGDGERARVAAQRPVTTIKARGLALPAPGIARADYDQAERLGVATLKLIAAYAMRLVAGDRSVHKVVLFDEAWFLLASRDGRRLIDRLNRLGRAENATLILATQQLTDVGEIENLIGTRFIFGQETAAEARRALELLGLDPDDRALVERVRSYRRGRCLMRDIDDRVAELQIETGARAPAADPRHLPGRPAGAGGRGMKRRLRSCSRRAGARAAGVAGRAAPSTAAATCSATSRPSPRSRGGLADRYPLSAYSLDYHVDVGVTDPEGVPPMIAQWAAAQLWSATSLLVKCTIDLFTWAFSLDLLNGADGALAPIGEAITTLYENVIGEAWMVAAILIAGIWGDLEGARAAPLHRDRRRARRLGAVRGDRAVLRLPARAHDRRRPAQWTNTLSLRVPVGRQPRLARRSRAGQAPGLRPPLRDAGRAAVGGARVRRALALRRHRPARRRRLPTPGRPARPGARRLPRPPQGRAATATAATRRATCASRPARRSARPSTTRCARAKRPIDRQFAGYKVDKADAPAVDAQQAGGAFQRLTFSRRRVRSARSARSCCSASSRWR